MSSFAPQRERQGRKSVLDLSRRSQAPVASLVQLAKADAFRSLGFGRREVSWAIKALRNDTLPLFNETDRREGQFKPELSEPAVTLPAMTKGREVVEDYRSHGLTLRAHPISFVRDHRLTRRFNLGARDRSRNGRDAPLHAPLQDENTLLGRANQTSGGGFLDSNVVDPIIAPVMERHRRFARRHLPY
jgi:DNA polymerase III alpha subunit